MRMARVNVYLPDDLAAEAKAAELNLSAVTQDAVRQQLRGRATDEWLARLPEVAHRTITHEEVIATLDAVRDEPTTYHGRDDR